MAAEVGQARVGSVEALDAFRSSLIVFLVKARGSVDEVSDEVHRTRAWLQHDRRVYWEGEIRRRRRTLDQAEQDLLGVRIRGSAEALTERQAAVRRAKQSLVEAEAKLTRVKYWNREYEHQIAPLVKGMEGLRAMLSADLPEAINYLEEVCRVLSDYSRPGMAAPTAEAGARMEPAPPPVEEKHL